MTGTLFVYRVYMLLAIDSFSNDKYQQTIKLCLLEFNQVSGLKYVSKSEVNLRNTVSLYAQKTEGKHYKSGSRGDTRGTSPLPIHSKTYISS